MNRRVVGLAVAGLAVFGLALGTTYLCVRHFTQSGHESTNGLAARDWANGLKLSPEQKRQLAPLEQALKKDLNKIQLRLAQDRMALCSLMSQEPSKPEELEAYVTKVAQLESEQQHLVIQHLLKVRDILTPGQKEQFFSSIMKGICESCRMSTHSSKDICGMCNIKRS